MDSKVSLSKRSSIEEVYTKTSTRIMWHNKYEFAFNIIGYNVGLGSIWRFTYLCFKDGGGAFLVPFLLVAVFCGIPILFMELAMGQYTKRGFIAVWDIVPLMRGIGFAGILMASYFMIYYALVIGWCIIYLARSFTLTTLPWATCDNYWNSDNCTSIAEISFNKSSDLVNSSRSGTLSTAEFWNNYVLQRTRGIENIGSFSNWKILGCFIAAWILCYLCIIKGIRTSGKVAYLTVMLPYVLMIALLVRGLTLEGSGNGVYYYVMPNVTKLADPEVWLDAGSQVIFALGICFGVIIGFGSFNKLNFDCYKAGYFFVATCCGSSLLFGFVVFSFLGHLAFLRNVDIEDVVGEGPGLVFQVIPAELSLLPFSQLWSAIFFLALFGLGIDGLYGMLEGCITALTDYFPNYLAHERSHFWRAGVCFLLLLLGLVQLFDGGIYIFEILNLYGSSGICILWLACFETIAIAWIYGVERFFEDVKSMIGYRPPEAMKYCLKYVAPSMCMVILIACCIKYSPLNMGDYIYPWWANFIGWLISITVVACIPVVAIRTLLQSKAATWKEKWKESVKSKYIPDWKKSPNDSKDDPADHVSAVMIQAPTHES